MKRRDVSGGRVAMGRNAVGRNAAGTVAAGPSRSLLLGRISRLHDEEMPISGARIDAGRARCRTDARGNYCLPLDTLELPLRLRVTAPGFFTRLEVIDWSSIMSGGMLVSNLQLVEDRRWLEPVVPVCEPAVAVDGEAGGEEALEEPIEVVSMPSGEEDEDRLDFSGLSGLALETASRPGSVRRRAAGSDVVPAGLPPAARAAAVTVQELSALGIGLEAGSFIPTESLPQSSNTLAEELAALVENLAEQDISVLGPGSPESSVLELEAQMTGSDEQAGLMGDWGTMLEDEQAVLEEDEATLLDMEAVLEDEEVELGDEEAAFGNEAVELGNEEAILGDGEAALGDEEAVLGDEEAVLETDVTAADVEELMIKRFAGTGPRHGFDPGLAEQKSEAGNPGAVRLQASDPGKPSTRSGASRRLESGEDSWYYDSGEWEEGEAPVPGRHSPGKGVDEPTGAGVSNRAL